MRWWNERLDSVAWMKGWENLHHPCHRCRRVRALHVGRRGARWAPEMSRRWRCAAGVVQRPWCSVRPGQTEQNCQCVLCYDKQKRFIDSVSSRVIFANVTYPLVRLSECHISLYKKWNVLNDHLCFYFTHWVELQICNAIIYIYWMTFIKLLPQIVILYIKLYFIYFKCITIAFICKLTSPGQNHANYACKHCVWSNAENLKYSSELIINSILL